ncbi:MAG: recombinase RecT, partial [Treponema sp.]|nr:recombinase RecT [Treponema sp.]
MSKAEGVFFCDEADGKQHAAGQGKADPVPEQGLGNEGALCGQADVVQKAVERDEQFFEVELGMGRKLSHKIDIMKERGEVIGYYCLVELCNGGSQFKVMSKKDVENHRN